MPPDVLEAPRLPALYRDIFRYAGLPLPPRSAPGEQFVLRCGDQPPGLFAALLEEAFVEDEAEVDVRQDGDPTGPVAIRPGFDSPCPFAEGLKRAAAPEGAPLLVFAVERRGPGGRLLGVTWAAVPEEEPAPDAPYTAAVARHDSPA